MTDLRTSQLAMLASIAREGDHQFRQSTRSSIVTALDVGRALNDAKKLVPAGEWLAWLACNTGINQRTARKYMRLDRERARLQLDVADGQSITINAALRALAEMSDIIPDVVDAPAEQPAPVVAETQPAAAPITNEIPAETPPARPRRPDTVPDEPAPTQAENESVLRQWQPMPATPQTNGQRHPTPVVNESPPDERVPLHVDLLLTRQHYDALCRARDAQFRVHMNETVLAIVVEWLRDNGFASERRRFAGMAPGA